MGKYQLSVEAEDDIDNILTYGIWQFGLEAAFDYHDALKNQFEIIAKNPLHFMKVDHISLGTRRSVFHALSIYFSLNAEGIYIERIIGSQDYNK